MVPRPYVIRGVATTETMPQPSSRRNFARSPTCHDVCDADTAMPARAPAITAPT
jgi:hypothetical protein